MKARLVGLPREIKKILKFKLILPQGQKIRYLLLLLLEQ